MGTLNTTQEGVGAKMVEGLASAVLASCTGNEAGTGALAAVLNVAVGSLAIECEHQAGGRQGDRGIQTMSHL